MTIEKTNESLDLGMTVLDTWIKFHEKSQELAVGIDNFYQTSLYHNMYLETLNDLKIIFQKRFDENIQVSTINSLSGDDHDIKS